MYCRWGFFVKVIVAFVIAQQPVHAMREASVIAVLVMSEGHWGITPLMMLRLRQNFAYCVDRLLRNDKRGDDRGVYCRLTLFLIQNNAKLVRAKPKMAIMKMNKYNMLIMMYLTMVLIQPCR